MAYSNRSLAYDHLKQYAKALADLNKAIELDPKNASAYNNRGLHYANHGTGGAGAGVDAALADYNKAIALNSDFPEAYYNRGHVYAELNMSKQAKADYDKALSMTSDQSFIDLIQKSIGLLK